MSNLKKAYSPLRKKKELFTPVQEYGYDLVQDSNPIIDQSIE